MDTESKIAVILILIMLVSYPLALYRTEQQQAITIDEKWIKQHGIGMKYLVSDTDGNVYSIEDCVWLLLWDIGWRIPLVSWYQNIVEVK